jgi:Holliday junction resolvasome RuvABC endonuclease subunit
MILGLDVSTSSTGWAILNDDGSLVDMGSFKITKYDNLFDKAQAIRIGLTDLRDQYTVSKISNEEPLQGFRRGMSSAHTLLTLARFNGIVSWLAFDVFNIKPIFFDSTSARRGLGIKIDKSRDTKDQIMEWVEVVTGKQLPRRVASAVKKKGMTLFAAGVNDAADAYVMARAAYLLKSQ